MSTPVDARARVRTPIAPMHGEPKVSSPQVSQQLAGHFVDVVAEEGEWRRVRGADAYEGWVHGGFLAPVTAGSHSAPSARVSLGCVARDAGGRRRALPLGAYLADDEIVQLGEAVELSRLASRFPAEPAAVARSAQELFEGTSYVWGGVTPWGADCSGLVQSAYALHGIVLPRDAWQQAECGTPGEPGLLDARTGDLLFFSDREDRRITHVGLALGGRRMVHLALGRGGYAVERLDDADDIYVTRLAARFVTARRLL